MLVLHLNTYDTGGAANAAIRLHLALLKEGVNSHMLFAKVTRQDIPNCHQVRAKRRSVMQHFFFRIQRRLGFAKSYWEKTNSAVENQPKGYELFTLPHSDFSIVDQDIYKKADVINIHWVVGLLDYQFFSINKKPLVWTLHDMNAFTGGCHYSSACLNFLNSCPTCPQLVGTTNPDLSSVIFKYKLKHLNRSRFAVVVLCDWMQSLAEKSPLLKKMSFHKIYNSIDYSGPRATENKILHLHDSHTLSEKLLLFVSENLENRRKGIDALLECIETFKDLPVKFCAVGGNQDVFKKYNNVISLGMINNQGELSQIYASVDAVLIPSREDNLPNVMLEALASGTPVVANNQGGMAEIIESGKNGILFDYESDYGLQEACLDIIKNKYSFERDKISAEALQLFSPKVQAQKYVQLYQNL